MSSTTKDQTADQTRKRFVAITHENRAYFQRLTFAVQNLEDEESVQAFTLYLDENNPDSKNMHRDDPVFIAEKAREFGLNLSDDPTLGIYGAAFQYQDYKVGAFTPERHHVHMQDGVPVDFKNIGSAYAFDRVYKDIFRGKKANGQSLADADKSRLKLKLMSGDSLQEMQHLQTTTDIQYRRQFHDGYGPRYN